MHRVKDKSLELALNAFTLNRVNLYSHRSVYRLGNLNGGGPFTMWHVLRLTALISVQLVLNLRSCLKGLIFNCDFVDEFFFGLVFLVLKDHKLSNIEIGKMIKFSLARLSKIKGIVNFPHLGNSAIGSTTVGSSCTRLGTLRSARSRRFLIEINPIDIRGLV